MAKRSRKRAPRSLKTQLSQGETAGLIRVAQLEPEIEYLFRHTMVQEAAYWSLLKNQRRDIHLAAGEAMEQLYPDRLEELASLLAHHFDDGGDEARALHYYTLAGDSAGARYANGEAIMAYGRALELADAAGADGEALRHLYTRKGRAEELSGHHDDAEKTYKRLETLAKKRGDRSLELAALSSLATIYSTYTAQIDTEKGIAMSQRALATAREIGDEPAQAKILWNLMLAHIASGKPEQGLPYGEESLAIARRLNLRQQMAFTLQDLGRTQLRLRNYERAWSAAEEARALWRELDNRAMLADNLISSTSRLIVSGHYQDGLSQASEALEISRSISNPWGQAFANMILTYIYMGLGEFAQAIHACHQGIQLGEESGFAFALVFCRCALCYVWNYLGQPGAAIDVLAEARSLTESVPPTLIAWTEVYELDVRLALHDLTGAQAALAQADRAVAWEDPGPPILLVAARARLLTAQGRADQAVGLFDKVLPSLPTGAERGVFGCLARLATAHARMALGDLDAARATLEAMLADFEVSSGHLYRWEALAALAEVDDQSGDGAGAARHRDQAREEITYLMARIGDPALEESFRARPDAAALLAK